MGKTRNGARTFLNYMAIACRLSHIAGFRTGLDRILGTDSAQLVWDLWEPMCSLVEGLIAQDNYYNKIDYLEEGVTEDIGM